MPDFYSNRDAVIRTKFYKIDESTMLKIKKSYFTADVPLKKGNERLLYYNASLIRQKGDDLIVSDTYSLDLKGYLPKVWVNDPMVEECVERIEQTYQVLKNIAKERKD